MREFHIWFSLESELYVSNTFEIWIEARNVHSGMMFPVCFHLHAQLHPFAYQLVEIVEK